MPNWDRCAIYGMIPEFNISFHKETMFPHSNCELQRVTNLFLAVHSCGLLARAYVHPPHTHNDNDQITMAARAEQAEVILLYDRCGS